MNQEEHNIQCACVRWFNYQWPEYRGLLFAVPNGGARSKATAGKLKAEGVVAGVADLILLVPGTPTPKKLHTEKYASKLTDKSPKYGTTPSASR